MTKYRDIGIKKDIGVRIAVILTILMFLSFICAVLWGVYFVDDKHSDLLIKYGVEAEAEIYTYSPSYHGEESGYMYQTWYRHITLDGSVYTGQWYEFGSESDAQYHIGEKIIITIVPDKYAPGEYISCHVRYADLTKPNHELHLAFAIICTVPVPFLVYLLCYRGIYRNELDEKILADFSDGFLPERRGEVVKVSGWIIKYVKVRYEDEGKLCERWARSWFSMREAKYLNEKKIIRIVPYKKTYGILEEIAVEKRQKKDVK